MSYDAQKFKVIKNEEIATGIFDMWEAELVTGEPRNSLYLRRD